MANQTFEKGFEIWREESAKLLVRPVLPDEQVPVIGLVGVYLAGIQDKKLKNTAAWRAAVLDSEPTTDMLKQVIPYAVDYIDEDYDVTLADYRNEAVTRTSLRSRCEAKAILDGTPENAGSITMGEYFLSRIVGQIAYNYAIVFEPLRLKMSFAGQPLKDFFPDSLEFIKGVRT